MPKQTIEIDVPDGLEVDKILSMYADVSRLESGLLECTGTVTIAYKPIERWRVPTKLDLLGRDSIPCRVRDGDDQDWLEDEDIVAISSSKFFTKHCLWRQCEIRDTEPNPRECWRLWDSCEKSFCINSYPTIDAALNARRCNHDDRFIAVRFVEVPE